MRFLKFLISLNDRILNGETLSDVTDLRELSHWMTQNRLITLWDISEREAGQWKGWKPLEIPPDLSNAWQQLIERLTGKAPLSERKQDKRGWGANSGLYTVAQGYKVLKNIPTVPTNPVVWIGIWKVKSISKIDLFMWTLAHHSLLTGENLSKKGFLGPFGCPL